MSANTQMCGLLAILLTSCVFSQIVAGDEADYESDPLMVQVEQGWLQGSLEDLVTGDGQYYSFKGIPYATPPVGELRFKDPTSPTSWEGVWNATAHGSKCPHRDLLTNELITGSEDCLFLNVYTMDVNPVDPLPVIVFIHGGGYRAGSGDVDEYGPDFLVARGVIVVTINYRLEAFGFLSLDNADVPGNAGLKDQTFALRWVQANIAQFGGNPDKVTIMGQSAGSAAVFLHVVSPMSAGLFQRAIALSGVPTCDFSISFRPVERAFMLGKILGQELKDVSALQEYLQSVDYLNLVFPAPTISSFEEKSSNVLKLYHFVPVVETDYGQERFLEEDPFTLWKEGRFNEVDIITGRTEAESVTIAALMASSLIADYNRYKEILVPRKILQIESPDRVLDIADIIKQQYFGEGFLTVDKIKEFISYVDDSSFGYDIQRWVRSKPSCTKLKPTCTKLYLYQFSSYSERNVYGAGGAAYGIEAAGHIDDLVYAFDPKKYNLTIDTSSDTYKLVDQFCNLLTNFAIYGTPTPDSSLGVVWPEYKVSSADYVDIRDDLTIKQNMDDDVVDFWKDILEDSGISFY